MAGKSSEGFTKSAQKHKFVRHRDVKMKDSELRKEAHIQKAMSEGVCDRCREKVQWRFRYDKYKPLTKPATCQRCKNKAVHKAYRNMCDPCAIKSKECPSCCKDIEASNLELRLAREASGRAVAGEKEDAVSGDELDEVDMEEEEDIDAAELRRQFVRSSGDKDTAGAPLMEFEKQREFEKIATTKYSKNRVPGAAEDSVFHSY